MGKKNPPVCSEQFNPYQSMTISIPLPVLRYRGRPDPNRPRGWHRLPHGAKLLYGRLMLFRGRKTEGFCAPNLSRLSAEMGETIDTVNRWLMELVSHGFIRRIRRGPGKAAECVFLRHSVFNSDSGFLPNQATRGLGTMRNQGEPLTPDFSGSDLEEMANADSEEMPNAYKEEKESDFKRNLYEKESSSSAVSDAEERAPEVAAVPDEEDDDRSLRQQESAFSAVPVERRRLKVQVAPELKVEDHNTVLSFRRAPPEEDNQQPASYSAFKALYPGDHFDEARAKPVFQALPPPEKGRCIERLQVYRKSGRWLDQSGRWIPLASNWLRDYEADPPPVIRTAQTAAIPSGEYSDYVQWRLRKAREDSRA